MIPKHNATAIFRLNDTLVIYFIQKTVSPTESPSLTSVSTTLATVLRTSAFEMMTSLTAKIEISRLGWVSTTDDFDRLSIVLMQSSKQWKTSVSNVRSAFPNGVELRGKNIFVNRKSFGTSQASFASIILFKQFYQKNCLMASVRIEIRVEGPQDHQCIQFWQLFYYFSGPIGVTFYRHVKSCYVSGCSIEKTIFK